LFISEDTQTVGASYTSDRAFVEGTDFILYENEFSMISITRGRESGFQIPGRFSLTRDRTDQTTFCDYEPLPQLRLTIVGFAVAWLPMPQGLKTSFL
jgi:hypothetical protein